MTVTIDVHDYFEVTINGEKLKGGSRSEPQTVTAADEDYIDRTNTVANNTTWDAWLGGAAEAVLDFDFLWVWCDTDGVYLELVCDRGGQVGIESFVVTLKANKPFKLSSNVSLALHDAGFLGTETADVIDAIRIRNTTGSSIQARVVLVT